MVNIVKKYGLIILLHCIIGDGMSQGHLFSEVSVNRSSVYVGQPVEVTVSVFTSTWFTSGVEPGNIKVNGAFTVYFRSVSSTERIDGKTFAGVRMIFNVFPYDDEDIIFPSLEIQVESPDEGSSKGVRKMVRTRERAITVKPVPANYDQDDWMVSSSVSVTGSWSGNVNNVKVGDVLERNVVRVVQGSVAELIPPIQWDSISGVSLYPSRGEVRNNRSRTSISASRTDGVRYLFEEEGEIEIPEMVILWWNPNSSKMQKRTLAKTLIQVQPNPDLGMLTSIRDSLLIANTSIEDKDNTSERKTILGLSPRAFGLAVLVALLSLYVIVRIGRFLRRMILAHQERYKKSEEFYFRTFQKAARRKDKSQTQNALYHWIDQLQLEEPSLAFFADQYGSEELAERLQHQDSHSEASKSYLFDLHGWAEARKNYLNGKSRIKREQKSWINP